MCADGAIDAGRPRSRRADAIERTIQLAGGSTYRVSLPKWWAKDQGLTPGSSVRIIPDSDRLVITPTTAGSGVRTTVAAVGLSDAQLQLAIRGAYEAGVDVIEVTDVRLDDTEAALERIAGGLPGVTIAEWSTDTVTLQSFLDPASMSLELALDRLQSVAVDAYEDGCTAASGGEPVATRSWHARTLERTTTLCRRILRRDGIAVSSTPERGPGSLEAATLIDALGRIGHLGLGLWATVDAPEQGDEERLRRPAILADQAVSAVLDGGNHDHLFDVVRAIEDARGQLVDDHTATGVREQRALDAAATVAMVGLRAASRRD